ncbi:MAG TPA: hypothetical protein VGC55_01260 [Dokdonella sp.]
MDGSDELSKASNMRHWAVRLPIASFIGFCAIAIGAFSTVLIVDPPPRAPLAARLVGVSFVMICLWILSLALRLAFDRPRADGGLVPALLLRLIAIYMIVVPVFLIITGRAASWSPVQYLQAAIFVFGSFGMWRIAARRRASTVKL